MPSITDKFGKSSIDNNYAIATTVKTTRTVGVTVLECFDLSKFNPDTPVFVVTYKKTTDPVTGIVSVTNLVSWKALVNTGANTLTNLTVAPGYADLGNAVGDFVECIPTSYWENSLIDGIFVGHNPDGSFKKSRLQTDLGNDGRLVDTLDELTGDAVVSGGIWTALSGLNADMTALAAYIDGYKNTVAAVATRAFTLSKDTYVDVLRDISTNAFTLVYTEVANNAASPALAANSLRLAKVVTSGSAVTSVVQYDRDSLYNLIRPLANSGSQALYLQSTSGSLTFTAPFDGILEAAHSMATWGFAGGAYGLQINCNNNAVKLSEIRSYVTAGDTQGKQAQEEAVFANIVKGRSYTVSVASWTGSGGGTVANSERTTVKLIPR